MERRRNKLLSFIDCENFYPWEQNGRTKVRNYLFWEDNRFCYILPEDILEVLLVFRWAKFAKTSGGKISRVLPNKVSIQSLKLKLAKLQAVNTCKLYQFALFCKIWFCASVQLRDRGDFSPLNKNIMNTNYALFIWSNNYIGHVLKQNHGVNERIFAEIFGCS